MALWRRFVWLSALANTDYQLCLKCFKTQNVTSKFEGYLECHFYLNFRVYKKQPKWYPLFVIFCKLQQLWHRRKAHPQSHISGARGHPCHIPDLYYVIAQFQEEVISGDRGHPCNIPDFKNTSTLFGFVGTVQNLSRWKIIYLGNVTLYLSDLLTWPFCAYKLSEIS